MHTFKAVSVVIYQVLVQGLGCARLTLSPVRGGHIVSPPVVLYYLKIEGHIFWG